MSWPPTAPTAQDLYDIAAGALPQWVFTKRGTREALWGAAKIFERVGRRVDELYQQSFLGRSTGIWLDQHLRDRDSRRQFGETDASGQQRVRTIADVATVAALEDPAAAIVQATDGIANPVRMVELRRDRAHCKRESYASRGYRCGGALPSTLIFIIPFGASASSIASVTQLANERKQAGRKIIIEVRRIP